MYSIYVFTVHKPLPVGFTPAKLHSMAWNGRLRKSLLKWERRTIVSFLYSILKWQYGFFCISYWMYWLTITIQSSGYFCFGSALLNSVNILVLGPVFVFQWTIVALIVWTLFILLVLAPFWEYTLLFVMMLWCDTYVALNVC